MIVESFAIKSPCWKKNKAEQALAPDKRDSRYQKYYKMFAEHDIYLFLHSLGCARASADYQVQRWNVETNEDAIAHAVVDSNDGNTRQCLEWGMRGWHAGTTGNNLAIGVEMCESDAIAYDREKSWLFTVKDRAKAERHCRTAYNGAVALFAELCKMFNLDPKERILSHKEAHARGIGSDHGDPEHYWSGLGVEYTMDGFRADVKAKMEAMEAEEAFPFDDVKKTGYAYPYILRAWQAGIVAGVAPGKFGPKQQCTREQVVAMIMRMLDYLTGKLQI